MAPTTKADWTVMVFLNAKNNLEPFSFGNWEQMANIGSTDGVHVLVEFGRPMQHYSTQFGAWSKTLRFRVTAGLTPTESNAVEDVGHVNMGDGAALAEFVTWSQTKYPAKRYFLIIWNHGQGWRVRGATSVRGPQRDRYVALRKELRGRAPVARGDGLGVADDMRIHGGVRYVSNDDDTGDKLYNREMQDALAQIAKKRKLDLIGFDACLMAMIETSYALRDTGAVLVGSEELEPGAGWNYERWLRPLVADPAGHNATKLGQLLVSAYRDEYGDHDDTTLSAVRLGRVPALSKAVTAFADRARTKLSSQLKVLKKAREACANYAPGYGLNSIDLARFLDQVQGDGTTEATLREKARAALATLNTAVLANYASVRRQADFGSHGVAIYFPKSKFAFDSDPDHQGYVIGNTHFPVEFVQREGWVKFLHAYLDRVPS
jgi:Clostripain family